MRPPKRCYGCGAPPRPNRADCYNCGRSWLVQPTDDEFWNRTLEDATWLLYGDLDEHFTAFADSVFSRMEERDGLPPSFSPFGFTSGVSLLPLEPTYAVAYWLFLSELVRLDFASYGTSPRGAWLTEDGVRFRRIFLEKHAANAVNWRARANDEDESR